MYEIAALEIRRYVFNDRVRNVRIINFSFVPRKDKEAFVDMLGDEGFTDVIKVIFPVVYNPLIEIYRLFSSIVILFTSLSNSDIPALLQAFFNLSQQTIDLMNAKE